MLIKKIYIKNFRSIVDQTINVSDLNIFVGLNDSGKSNVLKALNLFFNGKTDGDNDFDFNVDYSKYAQKVEKKAPEITIVITFELNGYKYSEVDWVKKWRRENNGRSPRTDERWAIKDYSGGKININLNDDRNKARALLDRIDYKYVPAVKGNDYFSSLLAEIFKSLSSKADTEFTEAAQDYTDKIAKYTATIGKTVKKSIGIDSTLMMPDDWSEIYKLLIFDTSSGTASIRLQQRGDGIKARHIPAVLAFIAKKKEDYREKFALQSHTIWGYEEPEAAIELSRCFDFAKEFLNYSNNIQIFLTTHSPAFYMLKDNNPLAKIKSFYVTQNDANHTKINETIKSEDIHENIGLMAFVAQFISDEREKYEEAIAQGEALKNSLERAKPNKILVIEDKNCVTVWNSFLTKYSISGVTVLTSKGCDSSKCEDFVYTIRQSNTAYNPKIYRILDRDGLTEALLKENINKLAQQHSGLHNYKVVHLPVSAIENFLLDAQTAAIIFPNITDMKQEVDDLYDAELQIKYRQRVKDKLMKMGHKAHEKTIERPLLDCEKAMETDKVRYLDGKDIVKRLNAKYPRVNVNEESALKGLTLSNFPATLNQTLEDIRVFFDN